MALSRRGDHWYGTTPDDIRELLDASARGYGGVLSHSADAACRCGARAFVLVVIEGRACVSLECRECDGGVFAGPDRVTVGELGVEVCACPCGRGLLEVCGGVAGLRGRRRQFLLGCRCPGCGLVGEYGTWPMPPRSRLPLWRAIPSGS